MPQHISYEEQRITPLVFQKQATEARLAFDLLELFNSTESLVNPLRQLASFAVDEMSGLRRENLEERKILMAAWNKERKIQDLMRRPSWQSPQQWRDPKKRFKDPWAFLSAVSNNVLTLRAEECSDVVRLYGEVVEQGAKVESKALEQARNVPRPLFPGKKSAGAKYAELDKAKEAYRKGGDPVWKVGRQRSFAAGKQVAKGPARGLILAQRGGIYAWQLKDASTVLKIDRAFGVGEGADISGTTTDNIFFLHRFVSLLKSQLPSVVGHLEDPIYHMLPLASIVACAHHSLLEVALAMSMNGINDYSIGLYTTLMPKRANHPARGTIMSLLQRAELHPNNPLIVVYYRGPGWIGGCYRFSKRGVDRYMFSRVAKADGRLLQTFARGGPYPQKDAIERFISDRARG
jgi:hypothetical protein